MGGNVANGSPIGDSAPVLMALDASLVLRRGEATRRVRLADFYTGYMKNLLAPGEFVQAIEVPLESRATCVPTRSRSASTATSRPCAPGWRSSSTAAARCAARGWPSAAWQRRCSAPRRRGGARRPGVDEAAVSRRAGRARERLRPAHGHARERSYRLQVAQNLLMRFWLETRPSAPLAADAIERVEHDGARPPRAARGAAP
jgi:xanthine dehydrogenase small subunit